MLRYDPNHPASYFLHECPACGSQFYGGGRALHNPGCEQTGYGGCVRIFGPKQVAEAKRYAAKYDEDYEWWGLSVSMLREHFPELLDAEVSGDE